MLRACVEAVFQVMPVTSLAADAFGLLTISLVSLVSVLGLLCVYRSVYFWLRIRRGEILQLGYFNGPWVTRIVLILVAIWWGVGEIVRLSFLRGEGRLFSSLIWQKNVCKFYILSNLGFAEPSMLLILVFLLHASLLKQDSGALSKRWNGRTICYVIFYCLPVFVVQMALIFLGPKLNNEKSDGRTKIAKYFTRISSLTKDNHVCTYPLVTTIFLGIIYALLISYVVYVGTRMLTLVINKGLQRRLYWLLTSVILFLPLRVILLGFSILPETGSLAYELIVFLAFIVLLCFSSVSICMLVHLPVTDSLVLRDASHVEVERMPYDDYYSEGVSLAANRSYRDLGRSFDDTSTKHGSISFRTMLRDDLPASYGVEEADFSAFGTPSSGRPMLPLRDVP